MTEVISVRFKNKGKIYFFDPAGISANQGDHVIVETAKGLEYAECVAGNHMVEDTAVRAPLRPVIRLATEEDTLQYEENRRREDEAMRICNEKIKKHELEMKLVDVEYNFEGNKILFFFTAEGRVDFRELVRDLASIFKTRIELRQIGVRDEARMLGGLGMCGLPFCCSQFLDDFEPVSIKMAKTQGLSLNPTKISGTCGRLMCCLKYEQDAYEELVKNVPKVDSFVETPAGKGSVVDVNLLKSTVRVRLEDQSELSIKTFDAEEITVLGGKAKRAEYLAQLAEGKTEQKLEEAKPRFKKSTPPQRTEASPAEAESELSESETADEQSRHNRPYDRRKGRPSGDNQNSQQEHQAGQHVNNGHKPQQRNNNQNRRPQNQQHHQQKPASQKQGEQGADGSAAAGQSQNPRNRYKRYYHKKPGGQQNHQNGGEK